MRETISQLWRLARESDKIWILPVILGLIILALLVIGAQVSPLPIFIYPLI